MRSSSWHSLLLELPWVDSRGRTPDGTPATRPVFRWQTGLRSSRIIGPLCTPGPDPVAVERARGLPCDERVTVLAAVRLDRRRRNQASHGSVALSNPGGTHGREERKNVERS